MVGVRLIEKKQGETRSHAHREAAPTSLGKSKEPFPKGSLAGVRGSGPAAEGIESAIKKGPFSPFFIALSEKSTR
jgi:hypothetical protein